MNDEYYMSIAFEEAQKAAEADEVPVGAVVVHNGEVIAKAHNQTQQQKDSTAHAEMLAIREAMKVLNVKYLWDCTLYVTLEPCIMCAGAIGWAQIPRLVYGAEDEKRGYTLFTTNALHPKCEVVKGVMAEQSAELLKTFFKNKRKNGV